MGGKCPCCGQQFLLRKLVDDGYTYYELPEHNDQADEPCDGSGYQPEEIDE